MDPPSYFCTVPLQRNICPIECRLSNLSSTFLQHAPLELLYHLVDPIYHITATDINNVQLAINNSNWDGIPRFPSTNQCYKLFMQRPEKPEGGPDFDQLADFYCRAWHFEERRIAESEEVVTILNSYVQFHYAILPIYPSRGMVISFDPCNIRVHYKTNMIKEAESVQSEKKERDWEQDNYRPSRNE
ncbi:hypothetical protein FACUT_8438 [Fusarium acutatum]|uniref:Uncharacterized protein n=1 Tax=Fusarium acutatum TaxID=78861 RepID=A0A8H4NJ74_9HYPO|nr:hypothetical protein FACUT_8438 [Fusarium acutatum]